MYHLNHPNILRIMEVLDPPAGPHYVMPYMPPGSLAGTLRPVQPADYVATVRVARDVASALAYAHGKGIIHRDLKPGNVLMDGDGHGQLSDFGLVRTVFNDSLTDVRQSQILGTAAYMSPAVARGEAEDTRCDIYGFGAMLYELLSGRPPYTGRSSPEVIAQVLAGPPKPMLKHNPHASAGLVQIAEGCMARELRDRYAKMTDVLEDLDRVEKGAPPLGPHGMPTQRRNNRMLPVAVVILLLVVLSAIGAWLKYRDKTRPTGNGMMHQPVPGAAPTQPAHGDAPIIAAMAFHNDHQGIESGIYSR
jgi:serine/threonine-protein kinase